MREWQLLDSILQGLIAGLHNELPASSFVSHAESFSPRQIKRCPARPGSPVSISGIVQYNEVAPLHCSTWPRRRDIRKRWNSDLGLDEAESSYRDDAILKKHLFPNVVIGMSSIAKTDYHSISS